MSNIITTGDLNDYPHKTISAAALQSVVQAVNSYIEQRTHRVWGDTKTVTDRLPWQRTVWLTYPDVTAVSSVKLGYPQQTQSTVDANAYMWEPTGRLMFYGWWNGFNVVGGSHYLEVTYTTGVSEVPDDLKLAALSLASDLIEDTETGGKEVSEVRVGSYLVKYADPVAGGDSTSNVSIIDSYRVRRA